LKFSGLVFGDYYAFAASHLDAWEGQHGFWIRRVYATYDHTFAPRLSARARLEINGNGELEGGPFTVRLKDALLRWRFAGRQALVLGLQATPTIEFVQEVWGPPAHREVAAEPVPVGFVTRHGADVRGTAERGGLVAVRRSIRQRVRHRKRSRPP
jgi:hypothetical protein